MQWKQNCFTMKKIPIGIQAFSSLIKGGFVYLDKTDMIYNIANTKACYFLSRPRRFGKSLTLSTLAEYFDGQKELFTDTKISRLETKWESRPVLYFDFNSATYESLRNFREELGAQLEDYETEYNIPTRGSVASRFKRIVQTAYQQTGKEVVVLVDEYDKPLLNNILRPELQDKIRKDMKSFYGVLKTCDKQIKMAFITGVTKFSKVSIFSDVNNLKDISAELEYATLCGATEQEIHDYLDCYVQQMADFNHITKDECYGQLKKWYEGYHFHPQSVDIYNPFGLLRALDTKEFKDYWFESGTPTFLVEWMKNNDMNLNLLEATKCDSSDLSKIDNFEDNPVPLLYQSGYLTIKSYDSEFETYTLCMPNREVAKALPKFILNFNMPKTRREPFKINNFVLDVRNGECEAFMKRLSALFADNSYKVVGEAELYFQNVFYLLFKLMGFYCEVERATSDGRMDAVVKTPKYVYIFEFKLDHPAKEAIDQINSKDYALPFTADNRKLFKVGVSFSSETRRVAEWVIQ